MDKHDITWLKHHGVHNVFPTRATYWLGCFPVHSVYCQFKLKKKKVPFSNTQGQYIKANMTIFLFTVLNFPTSCIMSSQYQPQNLA